MTVPASWNHGHSMTAGDLPSKEGWQGAEQILVNYGLTNNPQGVHYISCPDFTEACCLPKQKEELRPLDLSY